MAAVLAATGSWLARPSVEPVPALPAAVVSQRSQSTGHSADPTKDAEADVVVNVVGAVPKPGLATLPANARVADALRAAGGANPGVDLSALNLARRLADGEQIAVGVPAAEQQPVLGGGSPAPGAKLDLNAATREQLDALPGVGLVTAQRIVDWREQHGRFRSVNQLREVEGLRGNRLSQLIARVRV
ncbi:ComEA family DNA-binding protein [Solihabitans fulvus]|uniref:ComEA family DNA-binding protein n=1 Tax=Solihabitans fulvus TaxID=1892852 RepID=UPI001CB7629D|nr:ComEA family DNA-binding protein [Solihabitans fulvus]